MAKTVEGKRVDFLNLNGRRFDKLTVVGMKRFNRVDPASAFWKVRCECGTELIASTKKLTELVIRSCRKCELDEEFSFDEVLTITVENEFVPANEEVIYRGKAEEYDFVKVEYRGRILPLERRMVTSTGELFA